MTLDHADYRIFDPGVYGPLHEVSRREARAHYEKLMAEKEERGACSPSSSRAMA